MKRVEVKEVTGEKSETVGLGSFTVTIHLVPITPALLPPAVRPAECRTGTVIRRSLCVYVHACVFEDRGSGEVGLLRICQGMCVVVCVDMVGSVPACQLTVCVLCAGVGVSKC